MTRDVAWSGRRGSESLPRGVCRRCDGWGVQPLSAWILPDWGRSAVVASILGCLTVSKQPYMLQCKFPASRIDVDRLANLVQDQVLPHPCWACAGATASGECTLCGAGAYQTGSGRPLQLRICAVFSLAGFSLFWPPGPLSLALSPRPLSQVQVLGQ